MTEHPVYDPDQEPPWMPAKEWVQLKRGKWICVWELAVAEQFAVAEAAQRHPSDPRPGGNDREAALWLLAYSCRRGEEPNAARVWGDMQIGKLYALDPDDFGALLAKARGLAVETEEAQERARDFTNGTAGDKPSSPTGPLNISAVASPAS